MKSGLILFIPVLVYFMISLGLLYYIHEAQPEPYIDEEFHIPQAQKFCKGHFDQWDPKITTPPGLYAATLFFLTPFTWFTGITACDVFHLRLVNVFATSANFLLLLLIKRKLLYKKSKWLMLIEAFSLSIFPILYFFSFLYYTDAVSTMFVLAMYLLHLHDQNFTAAIAGLMATGMRQTNIIWVAYFAALKGYSTLNEALQESKKPSYRRTKVSWIGVIFEGMTSPKAIFAVLKKTIWYIFVGASFAWFLWWNGGIVMGDKTAHEATIHLPQVLYFLVTVAFFMPLHFVNFAPRFIHIVKKQKLQVFTLLLLLLIVVHLNTLAHPYLLADNRHYTFYVWKRVFQVNEWSKYALCPLYLYCILCVNESLKPQGPFTRYLTLLCITITLIPQKLLEPRYFILPFLMIKLKIPYRNRAPALTDLIVALIVNAATIYIFVECPFAKETVVRFIW